MPDHSDETSLRWILRRWAKEGGVGIVPEAAWVNLPQLSDGATAAGLERATVGAAPLEPGREGPQHMRTPGVTTKDR